MIEKPQPTSEAIFSLDYIEAAQYINQVLGFDQRDAQDHYAPELPHVDPEDNSHGQQDGGKYLDYWHYVMDLFGDFRNDSYVSGECNFVGIADETEATFGVLNWRSIIARTWANEYPNTYTLWMSW